MVAQQSDEVAGGGASLRRRQAEVFQKGFSFSGYERDSLFLNLGDGTYLPIGGVSGIDSISDGRGSVFADFDNDGDLDVFLRALHGPAYFLFRNNVGQEAGWLRIALEGTDAGRDAFGAVVRVKTSAGTLTKVKSGGAGFLSQSDPRLLFGLGADPAAEWVEVTWPGGKRQRFESLPARSSWLIVEGQPAPQRRDEPRGALPDPPTARERELEGLRVKLDQPLPDAPLTDLTGAATTLTKLIGSDRHTLVNLWATWCIPCRREMTELQKVHTRAQSGAGTPLAVIGISVDDASTRDRVPAYLKQFGITYPIYLSDHRLAEQVYVGEQGRVPLSFLLDPRGNVLEVFSGWSPALKQRLAAISASRAE